MTCVRPVPLRAADTSTRIIASTVYTVDPKSGQVRVDVRGRIQVDSRVGTVGSFTLTLPEGRGYTAVVGRRPASVKVPLVWPDNYNDPITIRVREPLAAGESTSFEVHYVLGDGDAKDEVEIRQMVAAFPVGAAGTPGVPGSTVAVTIPEGFNLDVIGENLPAKVRDADGSFTYQWADIDDPAIFVPFVTADRVQVPDSFLRTTVSNAIVGNRNVSITVHAWADDAGWGRHVASRIASALPTLSQLVGLPYIGKPTLVVRESSSRSIGGYAGLFEGNLRHDDIRIAFDADDGVVIHEAAHAWFDSDIANERWILEGFASYYADQTLRAHGWAGSQVELNEDLEAFAIPLNSWAGVGDEDEATELYAYGASLELARAIAERAGPDALAEIWQAMIAREYAYQPHEPVGADPERWPQSPGDTRYLLDLLEERTGDEYAPLFLEWAFAPSDFLGIAGRQSTRAQYRLLPERLSGWLMPTVLRRDMDTWEFGAARQRIDEGLAIALAWRQSVAIASRLHLALPDEAEREWERGDTDEALTTARHTVEALQALDAAYARTDGEKSVLGWLGMIGRDVPAESAGARALFEAGRYVAATRAASSIQDAAAQQLSLGIGRLGLGLAGLGVIGMGARQLSRWRRAHRPPVAAPES